jgi:hypothetical protein
MKSGLSLRADDFGSRPFGQRRKSDRVLIRIVRALPAPLMDGFDVRDFEVDRVYDVANSIGRYLIVAGYAIALPETVHDKRSRSRNRRSK